MAAVQWEKPDYAPIFKERVKRLKWLRANPGKVSSLKTYYKDNPIQFIEDWALTVDPRNAGTDTPVLMPFVLFPKQREWLEWTMARWQAREFGITAKSRDVGISWLAVSLSCTLCLFYDDMAIGIGSQQWAKVDSLGDPSCLFYKARMFMNYIPREFRGSWDIRKHAPEGRIMFPDTRSSLIGECGDQIGRGGRTSIYFIDESAHLEHPLAVDQSLSATTNCRFDMSSVCGSANPFADKYLGNKYPTFSFNWRDDPRKNYPGSTWYADICARYDAVTIAQEYEQNFAASLDGLVIEKQWVDACVESHVKLGIKPTGIRIGGLDVADRGADKNAFAVRHGILLQYCEQWSGKGSDLYETTERAFSLCDQYDLPGFEYDGDGMGVSIRGDARKVNEARLAGNASLRDPRAHRKALRVDMYRGSATPINPDSKVPGTDRTAADYYSNRKAEAWFAMRFRCKNTFAAVNGGAYDPDNLLSISKGFKDFDRLLIELSQAQYKQNPAGKMLIDKLADGAASPNLADAVVIAFAPRTAKLKITSELLQSLRQPPNRNR